MIFLVLKSTKKGFNLYILVILLYFSIIKQILGGGNAVCHICQLGKPVLPSVSYSWVKVRWYQSNIILQLNIQASFIKWNNFSSWHQFSTLRGSEIFEDGVGVAMQLI